MPPVSQARSGALVTWSVVTGILFVVSLIFAIYFYVDATKQATTLTERDRKYNEFISAGELTGPTVSDLKALRSSETPPPGVTGNTPVFNVLVEQRNQFAQWLAGPTAKDSPNLAPPAAKTALDKASAVAKEAGITLPTGDNLALAVSNLADGLSSTLQKNKDLTLQLTAAKQQQADQVKQFDAARAEMDKTMGAIRAEQQKSIKDVTDYQESKNASVAEIEKAREQERAAAQQALNTAQVQIAEQQRTIDKLTADLDVLRARLGANRINTADMILRQADGHVLRIPSKNTVYIDLGTINSITPGLTFEVYDKFEGIPPAGDPSTDEGLPKGKASIEVTRVGTNSSEARIMRQTPGTQLTEGDLIANLVYDPNTKYTFMVYGDFDIDNNGQATAEEAKIVQRLVTQWGGKLSESVNVDTDFVVLGKEPVLPSYSREDLQDPFNAKKLADAQVALDNYLNIKKQAVDLHIPVVNQNRFLYLIGYFAQAKR